MNGVICFRANECGDRQNSPGNRNRVPIYPVFKTPIGRGYGMTAVTWSEYELSLPAESTAVET